MLAGDINAKYKLTRKLSAMSSIDFIYTDFVPLAVGTTVPPYLFLLIFCAVAAVFPTIPLALAWLWRRFFQPPKPGEMKNATYECGIESLGEARVQFKLQYYLFAIIFLIFDVEAVFLVPFAVAFTGLPAGAFVALLVFLLLLIECLVWAWGKGCLEWTR